MSESRRKGWWVKQTFSNDFVHFMEDLYEKYGEEIFSLQGIANRHMDIAEFSRSFFKSNRSVAEISVDSNANVKEKNIQQYNFEYGKALMKLNSFYLLYRSMQNLWDDKTAKLAVEKVLNGEMFINDFTNFSMPYSYYQQTPLIVRVNGGSAKLLTMKNLFDEYEEFAEHLSDRDTIDATKVYKKLDFHNVVVGTERKKTVLSSVAIEPVIQKHYIEVLDGDCNWVELKRVLRHKNECGYVIYQTKNGDMAFVTDNHPVIMEDGSEISADRLSIGDVVKGSKNKLHLRSVVDVPEDMAYLMGFIAGDGSVGRHKFYQESKNLTDEEVSIKVDELHGNIHIYQKNIIETKIYKVVTRLFPESAIRMRDDRQLVFNSNHFRMLLAKVFGIGCESSYLKHLPSNMIDWNEKSVSAYVSGLIDSDGTLTPQGTVNIRMSAYAIINQLSDVLWAIGVCNHKSVKEIGESTSGYNSGKLGFLFGLTIQPNDDIVDASVKLSSFARECDFNNSMDTNERTNEVCKIFRLEAGTKKIIPSGENVLEFVYDITTESGTFYACGMTQHNCYAFDLRNLMMRGMNFFKGNMRIGPPKRSESFIALIIQTTAYISNQIMGASSYPDFFVVLDYYYRKEHGEDYAAKLKDVDDLWSKQFCNQFQNFVYSMNFPFRGNQSLRGNERILVNGKPVEIGQFVEDNLGEDQESAPVDGCWTYSLNRLTGQMEKKRITGVIRHQTVDDSLVEYKTALGQKFVGTRGHALFTREGLDVKEVTAETEVDNLLVPINFCKKTKVSTLDVPETGGRLDVHKLMLTPEIMYLIGQYLGDGSICGSRLSISTHNNEVNEKVAASVGNFFRTHTTKRNTIDVSIGKDVAALFKGLFGHGSHEKDIPREFYDEEYILHLIGGYIDADGHARVDRGSIVLSSANRALLESVQFILLGRGVVSRLGESEREGFGKVSVQYRLSIAASEASKLNPYLIVKKVPENQRLDYSRQIFDFDGVYQEIMRRYNIRGLAENGIVPERSRDKSMRYVDVQRVVEWIDEVVSLEEAFEDDKSFMDATLSPKYRDGDYSTQMVVAKSSRVAELKECAAKLRVFLDAVPVRIDELCEVEAEKYVYDISVEDNENFLTAANLYAHNSAFTNLSVMDMGFLKTLFDGYMYPDGTIPNLSSVYKLSKFFFEYFERINGTEGIFTFPVMTLAISLGENNEYLDPDFVKWTAKVNHGKAIANVFQSKPNAFSSCCFDGAQMCLTKGSGHVNLMTFEELASLKWREAKNNLKVFHNGSWVKCKEVQVSSPSNMYRIKTANKKEMLVTPDHLHPTLRGDVESRDIRVGDYLLFNVLPLHAAPETDSGLTYEQGFAVGAFLGDGSFGSRMQLASGETVVYDVNFSLNESCYDHIKNNVDAANRSLGHNGELMLSKIYNNVFPARISSRPLVSFLRQWVEGTSADTKRLNMDILLQSLSFRRGILDGWYATDGGNSNRCYTTSKNLAEQMEALITSLGMCSVVDESDGTDEPVMIRGDRFDRNHPLYCVRWYSPANKRSMKDVYIVSNNSMYFRVTEVVQEDLTDSDAKVYCFEVLEDEPYFTLPNGIITHNCRLKNEFDKVAVDGYQNSFGVGGLSIGCYDDKTEVLTDDGWKFFVDLSRDELICTLNPDSGVIEYQKPSDYIASHYEGKMHHYRNKENLDLMVTPNHNMVAKSRKTGEIKLIQSDDLRTGYNLPRIGGEVDRQDLDIVVVGDEEWNADDFYYLLGLYLGDGATYHVESEAKYRAYEISFQVSKEREINAIEGVLNSLGIKFNKNYIKTRNSWNIRFYSRGFWDIVQPLGRCVEKHISRDIIEHAGPCNLKKLIDGLLDTDGTVGSNGSWFYSSSCQLANDFMEICCLVGIPTRLFSRVRKPSWFEKDQRFIQGGVQYEVKLLLKDNELYKYSKYKSDVDYAGNIYCVTVPNHIMMVRRNGSVAWSGNSHRVVGLNLPRIAMEEKGNGDVFEGDVELAHKILFAHRKLIELRIKDGVLPLYDAGWINLKRQYSTVGLVGAYEYLHNKNMSITSERGLKHLTNRLQYIEQKISEWQVAEKAEGCIYNIEQIPAESMAIRLAELDRAQGKNDNWEMYSNQYIPLIEKANIYERFCVQGEIDRHTSGGAILHLNVDDGTVLTAEQYEKVMLAAKETGTIYFAVNYAYSECEVGHFAIGRKELCPVCNGKIVCQYTRVVGFITPVSSWNSKRKTWEYPRRVFHSSGEVQQDVVVGLRQEKKELVLVEQKNEDDSKTQTRDVIVPVGTVEVA